MVPEAACPCGTCDHTGDIRAWKQTTMRNSLEKGLQDLQNPASETMRHPAPLFAFLAVATFQHGKKNKSEVVTDARGLVDKHRTWS